MLPWLPITRSSSAGLFAERKGSWDELRYELVHFTFSRLPVLVFVEIRWFVLHCLLTGDTIFNDIFAQRLLSATFQRNALPRALMASMCSAHSQRASGKIIHGALQWVDARMLSCHIYSLMSIYPGTHTHTHTQNRINQIQSQQYDSARQSA